MNSLLIFAAIISTTLARPQGFLGDNDGRVSVMQSSAGTYKYTVHLKDSVRNEERFADGSILGDYTIIDASGARRTVKYAAGRDGFKILEGNAAVPVAPVSVSQYAPVSVSQFVDDTVVINAARGGLIVPGDGSSQTFALAVTAPQVPEYTPEVLAAREEFLALHRAAAARTA
ncbi:unnamed protein product [Ceutorhynchus assimilis]|uniref:Uncharacterized protein n=1 Tax=Ceutorhynchus assimilis TaxID=467358 RepID=A0A9N9QKJ0_9CUCU|nr:unnamed protein product [Ceutorhynchus assimilis]